jgi:hypothetical protein
MTEMLTQADLEHKPGCLWGADPHNIHRVPLDCVTANDLWVRIACLKAEMEISAQQIVKLKARIYDLEHNS